MRASREVVSHHFTIRAYGQNTLIVSYRVLAEPNKRQLVKDELDAKLQQLHPAVKQFEMDPSPPGPLAAYHAWVRSDEQVERHDTWPGQDKFDHWVEVLDRMSSIAAYMASNVVFDLDKRVNVTHLFSNMLSLLDAGFYDRLGI